MTLSSCQIIGRDDAGNVTTRTDAVVAARNVTCTYSGANRLASASSNGVWGSVTWTYDVAGSSATKVAVESGVTTNTNYIYPASSDRLDEVRNAATSALIRDPGYRANGQMSTDNRVGDGTYEYVYDNNGRLTQSKKAGAVIATYGYDAAGRRITRSVVSPALSRDYLYAPDGRMLAEADGTGATVREYIWLGNLPIAIVNKVGATTTTYYVHAGHLNQPLAVTDASKAKVWDAAVEPFGAARVFTSTAEMNLRLPGQYLHEETALHQNWMRDYDPALGQYIQPDPIGLAGGPNVYGYVGQDPLNNVDPNGLRGMLLRPSTSPPRPPRNPTSIPPRVPYPVPLPGGGYSPIGPDPGPVLRPPARQANVCPLDAPSALMTPRLPIPGEPPEEPSDDRCERVKQRCENHCISRWVGRSPRDNQGMRFTRCYNQCLYINSCGGQDYERSYQ